MLLADKEKEIVAINAVVRLEEEMSHKEIRPVCCAMQHDKARVIFQKLAHFFRALKVDFFEELLQVGGGLGQGGSAAEGEGAQRAGRAGAPSVRHDGGGDVAASTARGGASLVLILSRST